MKLELTDILIRNIICNQIKRSNRANIRKKLADENIELEDFVRKHVFNLMISDELKICEFDTDSYFISIIDNFRETNLPEINEKITKMLYDLICINKDIPEAELILVTFQCQCKMYMALLKMNYKNKFIHAEEEKGLKKEGTLPVRTIQEAAIFSLSDGDVYVKEKRYKINDILTNYFSELFLKCHTKLSEKEKFDLLRMNVKKAIADEVQEELKFKKVVKNQIINNGEISIADTLSQLGIDDSKVKMTKKFKKIKHQTIHLQDPKILKKIVMQTIKCDNGIVIEFPIEQYENGAVMIENQEGKTKIILQDIEHFI